MNIDLSRFTSSEQLRGAMQFTEMMGGEITPAMRKRLAELEQQEARERQEESARQAALQNDSPDDDYIDSETPIYDTLVRNSERKFKSDEKKTKCIVNSVNYLLSEEEGAEHPGLLLGRIQCGKTDTFVKIMALAFDKGIDVTIVLTKGTNALAKQTVTRMRDEFKPFEPTEKLTRRPIRDTGTGLRLAQQQKNTVPDKSTLKRNEQSLNSCCNYHLMYE